MKTSEYQKGMEHSERLRSKKERLEGLRALYATHEELGEEPYPGGDMWHLRKKYREVEKQLQVMAGL